MTGTTTFTLTGDDTLTLNNRVFTDQAFGTVSNITFPNELVNMKTGKNNNSVIAQNATGFNAHMVLRLVRGSADDQYMQGLVPSSTTNFPSTVLFSGTFVKQLGDGNGNLQSDTYNLGGGIISKQVEVTENVEGDVEQGVAVYNIKFANAGRVIS